jgi:hypothetical protein
LTNLSLTEYSAQPTPPSEDRETHIKKIVPDEFLLPNGNPDVSQTVSFIRLSRGRIASISTHCHRLTCRVCRAYRGPTTVVMKLNPATVSASHHHLIPSGQGSVQRDSACACSQLEQPSRMQGAAQARG